MPDQNINSHDLDPIFNETQFHVQKTDSPIVKLFQRSFNKSFFFDFIEEI